jgi:hypothetical protein
MKEYQITYTDKDDNVETFTGEYNRIDVSDNKLNPSFKDIKVYELDDDEEEFLTLDLFGYNIVSIDYNYVDEYEYESSWGIDFISLCIGIAVAALLFHH